jgi:hypothetical protein
MHIPAEMIHCAPSTQIAAISALAVAAVLLLEEAPSAEALLLAAALVLLLTTSDWARWYSPIPMTKPQNQ